MKLLAVRLCLIPAALFAVQALQAQQASFTLPDTICVNAPVQALNTTSGATNYLWNFCISSLDSTPGAVNLGIDQSTLSLPVYIDYAEDNGNYYAFVVNNTPGGLVELDFGNSLTNTPTYTSLGSLNVIPAAAEGIQMVQNNGEWYAIIVGGNTTSGSPPCIVQIDLGSTLAPASVSAAAVGTNWGNIGGLAYPHQLQLLQIGGLWYGFTVNYDNNTITEFQFGTSFTTPPTAINLGDLGGLNIPTGFYIVQQNGNWYMFVTSEGGNTLTRLDFGNSLLNPNPTATNLGNPNGTLHGPRAVSIINLCGEAEGLIVNDQTSDVVLLQFPEGIDSMPTAKSLGNIGSMDYPVSISTIFVVGSDLYAFVPNVDNNSITRLVFESCNNINIPNSTLQSPPAFSYSVPGIYNVNLMTNTGLPTQSAYCQTIVVLPKPTIQLPADTPFCAGTQVVLAAQPYPGATYAWNTGSDSASTVIGTSGQFIVNLNDYGCALSDTVVGKELPAPVITLPADTSICQGTQPLLTAQLYPGGIYSWSTGSDSNSAVLDTAGKYWMDLSYYGCFLSDTVLTRVLPLPVVNLPPDTMFCDSGELRYTTAEPVTFVWNTGAIKDSTRVDTSGYYWLQLNEGGCTAIDTIKVTIVPTPFIRLPADTSFCGPGVLQYVSAEPVSYTWSTGSMGSSTPVTASGKYILELNDQGCVAFDSTICTVSSLPVVNLGDDTALCLLQPYPLSPGPDPGGYTYQWQDGSTGQTYLVTGPGLYTVAVTSNDCTVKDSISIAQIPLPYFSLPGGDQPICPGEDIFLTPRPDTFSYVWQNGSTDSVFTVRTAGLYYVTGSNACGSYMDSVTIYEGICVVHVPSAFTPNGDGINDLFKVLGVEVVDHFQLDIYDRWGRRLFETEDKDTGWDGTYNGALQSIGAYVYELHFRYSVTGQSYMLKGTVSLIR